MRRINRRLVILCVLLLVMCLALPACAAAVSQDGLEVTLVTDKSQYSLGESVRATLMVENKNESAMADAFLSISVPDGYEFAEGSEETKLVKALAAGQKTAMTVCLKPLNMDVLVPDTGDKSSLIFWGVLLIAAGVGLYVSKNGQWKRFVSLMLCVVLFGCMLGDVPSALADNKYIVKNVDIEHSFGCGQQKYVIEASVHYLLADSAMKIDMTDSDNDGLVDGLEQYYHTDLHKQDTDLDGLNDYIEIALLGTDPLSVDSDQDGISDADEDCDGDTLSNLNEIYGGTSPVDRDSDADSLDDNEEPSYHTDPTDYDTDNDGASDGDEVRLGTDPLKADRWFNVSVKSDFSDSVKASVTATLNGAQVDSLAVEPLVNSVLFPKDMPGYLGMAYDFSVDGQFDEATISFEFDASLLSRGVEPAIFYFNEADQTLEELPTTIRGNVASTTVNHFSTYVLIDRNAHYEAFEWEDVWAEEGGFSSVEIVLVIDDSGSMTSNDRSNQRLSVARNLIDNLPEDSKMGIVWFANNSKLLTTQMLTDRNAAKAFLTTSHFKSSGGTYMYTAINDAFSLFQSNADDVLKMMVVLSDGNSSDLSMHSSTIAAAVKNNVRIYTVGLGSSTTYFNKYLQPLASMTDGVFYLASNSSQLFEIYNDINKKIDIETDTDGDTIPDYYETHMFSFNGKKIELDKNDPEHDADKDGLLDQEEVKVELVYNSDKSKVYVKGKYRSFPNEVDSDHDGIDDKIDPFPLDYTITDRTLALIEGLSYSNLVAHKNKTLEQAIKDGATIKGISNENVELLKDAIIVYANDSGTGGWDEFWDDAGLGSIALKFVRRNNPTAIIYALRGTEFGEDFVNDFLFADIDLGVGLDTWQSQNAFSEYKSIANNRSYNYYVTGHSLGGRLAQDVVYKTYDANRGGLFKTKANIPVPVHSATFNALGYNQLNYALLKNAVLNSLGSKIVNFYYWQDLIGETMGNSAAFSHIGRDVELLCKNKNGKLYRQKDLDAWIQVHAPDLTYHGIKYFQDDYDLLYTSPHSFTYWVE